jgi:LemA protein
MKNPHVRVFLKCGILYKISILNIFIMEQKNFLQRNMGLIIGAVVVLLVVFWGVSRYNSFVVMSQNIDAGWAQVENQLQRRFDLIPNLEASVKGAMTQEKDVFKAIADARTRYAGAQTTNEKVQAAGQVESALARLLVVVEQYPQLASIGTVKDLMVQLEGTENRITVERGKYNDSIRAYNAEIKQFPTVLVARLFGFSGKEYFEAPKEAQTAPKIDLTN